MYLNCTWLFHVFISGNQLLQLLFWVTFKIGIHKSNPADSKKLICDTLSTFEQGHVKNLGCFIVHTIKYLQTLCNHLYDLFSPNIFNFRVHFVKIKYLSNLCLCQVWRENISIWSFCEKNIRKWFDSTVPVFPFPVFPVFIH